MVNRIHAHVFLDFLLNRGWKQWLGDSPIRNWDFGLLRNNGSRNSAVDSSNLGRSTRRRSSNAGQFQFLLLSI